MHARIAIVGVGHVGATAAYALMLRTLFRDIVRICEAIVRDEKAALPSEPDWRRPRKC